MRDDEERERGEREEKEEMRAQQSKTHAKTHHPKKQYNDASKLVDDNFDDPRLTDYNTLLRNLSDLRSGRATDIPIYDFKTSSRVGYRRLEPPAARVVVLEGIFALSEKLRPLLDLRVSVRGGVHLDLVKRVMRDISRSGQGPEEIIEQVR
jgi:uridine kinase